MAALTIAGRAFELAPYKLGALRKAAPHIDAINASAASIDSIEGLLENAEHIIAILAIGLERLDPEMTASALEEMLGAGDIPMLGAALREVMADSGLAPKGEAGAPSEPAEAEGAWPTSSEASSAN